MPLRLQTKIHGSKSYQKSWTLEEIAEGLKHFFKQNNRYPTAHEFDAYPYLPSGRTIQRSFGGLIELRRVLKLKSQNDFRTGQHSTERAKTISERAHKTENVVYGFLQDKFGKQFVHREYFFTDDKRTRADFFVYDSEGGICVDVFYPSNKANLTGCLNNKLDKYKSEYMRQYPVIFLQMNDDIKQTTLEEIVARKKKSLIKGQKLMAWDTFQEYCKSRKRLHIK